MSKKTRNVESYWAKRQSAERKRPHVVRYWRDHDGRWQYRITAGNNVEIANSKRPEDDTRPDGYATKRWALHKAKRALPRGVEYRLVRVNEPS